MFQRAGYPEVADLLHGLVTDRLSSGARRSVVRESEGRTLVATATAIESADRAPRDYVLFFEDVSQIAATQRMEAWREVARRIAHEIKNPLTPIQLSAQRMQRKLADRPRKRSADPGRLDPNDQSGRGAQAAGERVRRSRVRLRARSVRMANALVAETLPLFRSRPEIAMRFESDPSLPRIEIHRERSSVRSSIYSTTRWRR
jgi:two-component system nitrogen regulation sensor histidine kinase NtrY